MYQPIYKPLEGPSVKYFRLMIYTTNFKVNKKVESFNGKEHEWNDLQMVRLPGFSSYESMDLREVWIHIFEQSLKKYTTEVVALETIRKFGDSMQLQTLYRVKIVIKY